MSSSSSNTPEPLDPSFQIRLPAFEGPLDLLLHLIKKHELEVLDLPIAFVTERYLEYIGVMEKLSLDIASEYLVMAATLAYIKSRMLLPQEAAQEEEEATLEEEIDPRAELIRRLLEYQKYKVAAEQLAGRGVTGRDVFLRGADAPEATGPAPLASMTLYKLLDAFQGILKRAKTELAFAITTEGVSIQERMRELTDRLRAERDIQFDQLFEGAVGVFDLVITFLAILEMAKRRLVRIYQAEATSAIHLRSTVVDAGEDARATEGQADAAADPVVERDAALREVPEGPVVAADGVASGLETAGEQLASSLETLETVGEQVASSVETMDTVGERVATSPVEDGQGPAGEVHEGVETVETVGEQVASSVETMDTAGERVATLPVEDGQGPVGEVHEGMQTVETVGEQVASSVETLDSVGEQAATSPVEDGQGPAGEVHEGVETVEIVGEQVASSVETLDSAGEQVATSPVEDGQAPAGEVHEGVETVEIVGEQVASGVETVQTVGEQVASSVETVDTVGEQVASSLETVETEPVLAPEREWLDSPDASGMQSAPASREDEPQ